MRINKFFKFFSWRFYLDIETNFYRVKQIVPSPPKSWKEVEEELRKGLCYAYL